MGRKFLTTPTLPALPSAPSSPSVGDMYFDTNLGKIGVYTNSGWVYNLYQIEDGSITTSKIADGAITPPKLASGAAIANIGYTPVNKAGDTMSGPLDVSGNVRGIQFISTATTGTPPLQVSSTTKVTNLNADLLDGYDASTSATANTVAVRDSSGNISANAFVSTASTGTAPLQVSSTTRVANLNADLLDGYDSTDFARKAENATITGSWTFTNTISAGNASATIGTLTVNNDATIKGGLTVEGGANAITIKESSSDITPGYLEKVGGTLSLTYTSNNAVRVHRGTATGRADIEISKDAGSGDLPIYLRFHQFTRYWMSIKAYRNLISFVNGDDTGFVDIQAKRITATQDLVVAGNTIANSSGIPYTPLPDLGNRGRDILVDRVAVWGDGMYPFALDLYKSDGWFMIPRTVYYNGQNILGSIGARNGTVRVLRMYIVGVDNARNIYNPANSNWNNGRTTGVPWIRLTRGSNTWNGPLTHTWGIRPNTKAYIIELPTSFLNGYFQVALGIWWDTNSPSWPTTNIPGDTVTGNYQNYGIDITWTIYQVYFEIYDRY